jgi:hypothetical protein
LKGWVTREGDLLVVVAHGVQLQTHQTLSRRYLGKTGHAAIEIFQKVLKLINVEQFFIKPVVKCRGVAVMSKEHAMCHTA